MLHRTGVIACTVGLLLLPGITASAKEHRNLSVHIEDDDGSNISLSISNGLVDAVVEGLAHEDMDCDGKIEPDIRRMLEHLDRRGNGSRYRLEREDGEVIAGRRRNNQLILKIEKPDATDTEVTLPWQAAECMLGKAVSPFGADDRLEVKIEQGEVVRVRIE